MTNQEKVDALLGSADRERKIKSVIGIVLACTVFLPIAIFTLWAIVTTSSV